MELIEVQGIDPDGEPQVALYAADSVGELATRLCTDGWKYARLARDGKSVGEVRFREPPPDLA